MHKHQSLAVLRPPILLFPLFATLPPLLSTPSSFVVEQLVAFAYSGEVESPPVRASSCECAGWDTSASNLHLPVWSLYLGIGDWFPSFHSYFLHLYGPPHFMLQIRNQQQPHGTTTTLHRLLNCRGTGTSKGKLGRHSCNIAFASQNLLERYRGQMSLFHSVSQTLGIVANTQDQLTPSNRERNAVLMSVNPPSISSLTPLLWVPHFFSRHSLRSFEVSHSRCAPLRLIESNPSE